MIDCNEWKAEKRHECANMGKVKRLELWWQLYRTSLPVRDLENFRPMGFSWTECTWDFTIWKIPLPLFHGSTALVVLGLVYEVPISHSLRHTTVGRTSPNELPARCTDLYLITHNTHNKQTSMYSVGFKPAVPASERPQAHALYSAATEIVVWKHTPVLNMVSVN